MSPSVKRSFDPPVLTFRHSNDWRYATGGYGGDAFMHRIVGNVAMLSVDADPIEVGSSCNGPAEIGSGQHLARHQHTLIGVFVLVLEALTCHPPKAVLPVFKIL